MLEEWQAKSLAQLATWTSGSYVYSAALSPLEPLPTQHFLCCPVTLSLKWLVTYLEEEHEDTVDWNRGGDIFVLTPTRHPALPPPEILGSPEHLDWHHFVSFP